MSSDIFEEYIKLAEKEGWVEGSDFEGKITKSAEPTALETLYGIKPNGKEDDTHIVDKAHPETAVVAPAHDKMNSIVENVQERQNIINYIARKTPGGHLTHHRYVSAFDDLNKTLVRTAFMLDNKGEDDLMKFADDCIGRLEKQAVAPALAAVGWWAFGLANVTGLLAYINKTDHIKQNVIVNGTQTIEELEDLRGSAPVEPIIKDIQELISLAKSFQKIQLSIQSVQDAAEAQEKYADELAKVDAYIKKLQEIQAKIPQYISTMKSMEKQTDLPNWLAKLKRPFEAIFADDTEDVINALGDPGGMVAQVSGTGGLYGAINDGIEAARHFQQMAKGLVPGFKQQLEQQSTEQATEQQAPASEKSQEQPAGVLEQTVQQILQV